MVSFLNEDNNGDDQVENSHCEGLEEITPRSVDDLYPCVQLTYVDDKEDSSKDHLNHWQRELCRCGGDESDQIDQAQYNLSKQKKSLEGKCEVGAVDPAARGGEALGIHNCMSQNLYRLDAVLAFLKLRGQCTLCHLVHCLAGLFDLYVYIS